MATEGTIAGAQRVRHWRDRLLATGLLFVAGVGAIFRSLFHAVETHVPLPAPLFAAMFLAYCVVVVVMIDALVLSRGPLRRPAWIRIFLVLFVAFLALWPFLAPAALDGRADRDDALDIGVRRLLAGDDPWSATTQLGNHISPLLGGLILALPFALVATSSLQTAFWVGTASWLGDKHYGTRLTGGIALLLVSSPVILNEIVFESDVWVLAVIMAIATLVARAAATFQRLPLLLATAAATGLVVSDRFVFLGLVIPIALLVRRAGGWRLATLWSVTCAGTAVLVYTVMIWLYPASIESIGANAEKAEVQALGQAGVAVGGLMVIVAIVGGLMARSTRGFLWAMALTMFTLPAWQAITLLISGSATTFNDYAVVSYSAPFLVLGLLALVLPSSVPIRRELSPTKSPR